MDGRLLSDSMRYSQMFARTSTSMRSFSVDRPGNEIHPIRVMISTFNIGNSKPEGLEYLVPQNGYDLDLLALGFQESIYETDNFGKMLESREHLLSSVQEILGNDFVLV
jgi:hypothetical protein